jgi:hypothetical protein
MISRDISLSEPLPRSAVLQLHRASKGGGAACKIDVLVNTARKVIVPRSSAARHAAAHSHRAQRHGPHRHRHPLTGIVFVSAMHRSGW